MKFINILTLVLVIVGGLNWGLVGLFGFDLVAAIFGAGSMLSQARLHPGRALGGLADRAAVFRHRFGRTRRGAEPVGRGGAA